jgi:hypothetical protein
MKLKILTGDTSMPHLNKASSQLLTKRFPNHTPQIKQIIQFIETTDVDYSTPLELIQALQIFMLENGIMQIPQAEAVTMDSPTFNPFVPSILTLESQQKYEDIKDCASEFLYCLCNLLYECNRPYVYYNYNSYGYTSLCTEISGLCNNDRNTAESSSKDCNPAVAAIAAAIVTAGISFLCCIGGILSIMKQNNRETDNTKKCKAGIAVLIAFGLVGYFWNQYGPAVANDVNHTLINHKMTKTEATSTTTWVEMGIFVPSALCLVGILSAICSKMVCCPVRPIESQALLQKTNPRTIKQIMRNFNRQQQNLIDILLNPTMRAILKDYLQLLCIQNNVPNTPTWNETQIIQQPAYAIPFAYAVPSDDTDSIHVAIAEEVNIRVMLNT